ncbi:MAG: hypothetical protein KC535_00480 [Nanoarchaeota archaeon]|nr:hypothetical protein [Nanoarchaeota archaeon]
MDEKAYDQVASLFKERLEDELAGKKPQEETEIESRAYDEFKQQYLPKHLSFYEKICQFSEKTLPMKPQEKDVPKLQEAINTCHLNTSPTGIYSSSFVIPLGIVLFAIVFFFMLPVLFGGFPNMFFIIFSLLVAVGLMIPLQKLPFILANRWRLKASNQMVLAIFYMVTYMRHTSNIENAINFAAEHLAPPLSLDLRKVMWDVETQTYDSMKNSLDAYLLRWKDYNMEFVESIHLIQSSLMESSNDRRLNSLDKALTVILDETFEKMLHYAHGLKGPLTTLNMLGVVLPILTLVILPLVVSFMDGFRWYHLFAIYNIALPALVYSLGMSILTTRPGGSGQEDITKKNPELKKYQNVVVTVGQKEQYIKPIYLSLALAIFLLFIGFLPLLWSAVGFPDYGIVKDSGRVRIMDIETAKADGWTVQYYFLGYRERDATGELVGPFGLGAMLLSLMIPLGIGYSTGLYYKYRTQHIVKVREQAKKLELEFSGALFQLGNRIGDGIPAEAAFGRVAQLMPDTVSGKFFNLVHVNVTNLGMSVEQAIFDKDKGALKYYPSDLIESSMKVLVESSKKGPLVASQALINVSEYLKQMHRVDERLKDLLGDVISGMKSQVLFLTPVISGIVVGITSMITKILGTLGDKVNSLGSAAGTAGAGGGVLQLFGVGIPSYHFQIVVGLYVVQLSYILTVIANGIENGPDRIGEETSLGMQMTKSILIYTGISFAVILIFNLVATTILTNVSGL